MCFGALDKMSKRFENILTGHEWAGNWRDILLAGNGLGMDCEQKNALLEADNLAVRFYTFATGRLREARESGSKSAYEDAIRLSEDARNQCEISRRELEVHAFAHGC
jgi:hypothetical protein